MTEFLSFDGITHTSFLNVPCERSPVKLFFFFFLTSEATRQKTTDAKPRSNPSVQFNTVVSLNTASIIQWIQRKTSIYLLVSVFNFGAFRGPGTYSYVNTFAYCHKEEEEGGKGVVEKKNGSGTVIKLAQLDSSCEHICDPT